ncbi:ABC transporter permease, partial [Klebsiella oxytoca]
VVSSPNGSVTLYTHSAPSMQTEQFITSQLEKNIEDLRIRAYDIDNLEQIMKEVEVDLTMQTFRLDKEEETATSSILS